MIQLDSRFDRSQLTRDTVILAAVLIVGFGLLIVFGGSYLAWRLVR